MDIQANKTRFIGAVRKYILRDGVEELIASLEKSDFFTAPASTKYHDSEEGGLCYHSLKVFENLYRDVNSMYDHESLAIVSLFHDLCKVGFYKIEMRNKKDDNGKWVQVPFYTVEDSFPFGHGEKSVYLLQDKLKLTVDEVMAIRWHMGLSVPKEEYTTMGKAFEQYPLALHLHIADMKATYLK